MRELELYNKVEYPRNAIITGTGRCGKTTLCRIWASTQYVDWIEEPHSLNWLSYAYVMGMNKQHIGINLETYETLWGMDLKEIIYDNILGRNYLNFRPGDLSSVWEYKGAKEIMYRLNDLRTRDDVMEYVKKINPLVLIDIPELICALTAIDKAKHNSHMLLMIREPAGIATDIEDKGWYSDENLLNPLKGNDYTYVFRYKDKDYRLPFWLQESDAEEFIYSTEYGRGLIYWLSIAEESIKYEKRIDETIRYEDMLSNPLKLTEALCLKYGGVLTDTTEKLCRTLLKRSNNVKRIDNPEKILSHNTIQRVEECCLYWNYI